MFSQCHLNPINVLGPVWTAVSRLASYRMLTIVGGLLSSIGVILVSLSDSMLHLAVCMMLISKLLDFSQCSTSSYIVVPHALFSLNVKVE